MFILNPTSKIFLIKTIPTYETSSDETAINRNFDTNSKTDKILNIYSIFFIFVYIIIVHYNIDKHYFKHKKPPFKVVNFYFNYYKYLQI